MDCLHCRTQLLNADSLCFYKQNEKSVSLIVKHEQFVIQETNFKIEGLTTKCDIKCPYCSSIVGKKLPMGPNKTKILAFGNEKVMLLKRRLDKKTEKWSMVFQLVPFSGIPVRTDANFFGKPLKLHSPESSRLTKLASTQPIVFAAKFSDFLYTDLLASNVVPRDYQIAAYIEALQRDLLVVIPTGAGKTLIASIVAARMKALNPNFMVLFVAERVPLVFQQGEAISFDTDLDVCCLSSENNTRLKQNQLKQGEYDVLVSTAGAFVNLEPELGIHRFCCVIFDECHHASKAHNYVKILEKIKGCSKDNKPRVIGLTASPPSVGGDIIRTKDLLDEFRQHFFNAPIYYNSALESIAYTEKSIEKLIVPLNTTDAFIYYTSILQKELSTMATLINRVFGSSVIVIENWGSVKNRFHLLRMLYHLESDYNVAIDGTVKSMKKICTALDITEMLGVTYANKILESLEVYSKLGDSQYLSPRLQLLQELLVRLDCTSKIILFVHTRQIAQILTTLLKEDQVLNNKFSPLKIVGQYGVLGMGWESEQKDILDKFRHGNCNLLVSTSVLEEGLDVPECDVVIRFDGIKSLTSFKQSKGRARKAEGSRFIVILSEEEHAAFNDIQASEAIVRTVLEAQHSLCPMPTNNTMDIQKHILANTVIPEYSDCSVIQSKDCAAEFYIAGAQTVVDLQECISELLLGRYFLRVKLIEKTKNKAEWKSKGIFPTSDTMLTLGLQCQSHSIYPLYRKLTVDWNFTLNKKDTHIWSRIPLSSTKELLTTRNWSVESIQWGKFNSAYSFYSVKHLYPETGNSTFQIKASTVKGDSTKSILITIPSEFTFEINFLTIYRFIFADWTDEAVTLYFPLTSSPIVRSMDEEPTRFTGERCELLTMFGQFPVVGIKLEYSKSDWSYLWTFLHSSTNFPVPVFDTRILIETPQSMAHSTLAKHPSYRGKLVQDCLWAFSVAKHNRCVCISEDSIRLISQHIDRSSAESLCEYSTLSLWRLILVISSSMTPYFTNLFEEFSKQTQYVSENKLSTPPVPPNYINLECAMATPSRVIPLQPILTQSNRLFRKYPNERFLNLAFREEQGQPMQDKSIFIFVKRIIQSGLEVDTNKFHFLVCSGSQLRAKRAIFIHIQDAKSAVERIREIRFELIGNSPIYNDTKYLSRLGLFCTSDHPSCAIRETETDLLPDLTAENGLLLTDGAGKISRRLALEIVNELNLENHTFRGYPSAFQVRLAGLKGVLTVVDEDTDPDFQLVSSSCKLIYRKSMKKIDWTDSTLCIVKYANYNKLFLNMQVINLLTSLEDPSGRWDPEIRLKSLFEQYINNIALIFTEYEVARGELGGNLSNFFRDIADHFDILSEPYHLSLLRCIYTYKVKNLVKRTRIPIQEACLLMGIPDPIGVLREGEISVCFQTESNSDVVRLNGRVLVYKNPCLHPGDLLTLTAVDRPELRHLVNVIVFPIIGITSLPASSGGSDLDGDEFAIIWDNNLIPPENSTVKSLNYNLVLKAALVMEHEQRNIEPNDPSIQGRLSEAYHKVVSNDSLGIISHYHLSICDQQPQGARDALSIELAKAASLAVDSPKTGVIPEIPNEARRLIAEHGYPDFMQKSECTSYVSSKLLGEFYRVANSICYENHDVKTQSPAYSIPVQALKAVGYRKYLSDAKFRYHQYANALQRIMLSFGVETEAEAITGLIIECHPMLSADKGKIANSLKTAINYLVQEFRDIFHRDTPQDDFLAKASAWYHAAYRNRGDTTFLSFPWIVGDYLCSMVPIRTPDSGWYNCIGQSAKEYFCKNSEYIKSVVDSKLCVLPQVNSCVNEHVPFFIIKAFGSVPLYLCGLQSDIDLSISLTVDGFNAISRSADYKSLSPKQKQAHILNTYISPCITEISNEIQDKITATPPIISFTMDSLQDGCTGIQIDLAVESNGVQKSEYIKQLYVETRGIFFVWLWIIIHWARHVGILKFPSTQDNTGIILTAEFEAFALYIYDRMSRKPNCSAQGYFDSSLDNLIKSIMKANIDSILGMMLEEFFRLGAKITKESDSITYTWPVVGEPTHTISKGALKEISDLLLQAWHCLVFTRNTSTLFDTKNTQSLKRRFSPFISDQLRQSTEFYRTLLEKKTGARISIEQAGRNLLLIANGPARSIHDLYTEISIIEKNTALSYNFITHACHYMLEGCMALVMYNQETSPRVKLHPYAIPCYKLHHNYNQKSHVMLASEAVDSNWLQQCIFKLQSLMWNQLHRFPASDYELLESLQFKTRFGFFYILDGQEALQNVGDSLSLAEFEKCLLNSKKFPKHLIEEDSKPINFTKPPPNPKPVRKSGKRTKSLSSAFCPGIQVGVGLPYSQNPKHVYQKALDICGFKPIDFENARVWRIDVKGTIKRDLQIDFNKYFEVIRINERPFIWMLATIVGDRREPLVADRVHDLRLRVESYKSMDTDSQLFTHIFHSKIDTPMLSVGKDGFPILHNKFLYNRVKLIKHNAFIEYYKVESCLAKICCGFEYSGDNVMRCRQFCELSLYHSETELREAINTGCRLSEVQTIVTKAVETSLKVSNTISGIVGAAIN